MAMARRSRPPPPFFIKVPTPVSPSPSRFSCVLRWRGVGEEIATRSEIMLYKRLLLVVRMW